MKQEFGSENGPCLISDGMSDGMSLNQVDLLSISIWSRAHRKHLSGGGGSLQIKKTTWKGFG